MPHDALITGGAGFIGSHLAHRLLARGSRVIIVDDLSTGSLDNIAPLLSDRCSFVHGRAGDTLRNQPQLLGGIGQVYHLAAAVGVQLVVDDPVSMIRNNVEETATVLDAAAQAGACVLITSSSEVYGRNPWMPLAEDHELHYGPTTSSRWSYGLSKALDEHLALAHHKAGRLAAVIVRLFNTIGPRQVGHYGMVVPRFVAWARANQPLQIYGDGRQTRSFCHVADVVDAMTRLMDEPQHHGQVFNLGSDDEISIDQLADRVIQLTGSTSEKRYIPYQQAYDRAFDDPVRRVPDLAKIAGAIGYHPSRSLDQTLKQIIQERSNRDKHG
ncbi:MAG: NAD-dependent epimerase/dehydratase family protein [Phycisphaeraceae bacterium]